MSVKETPDSKQLQQPLSIYPFCCAQLPLKVIYVQQRLFLL